MFISLFITPLAFAVSTELPCGLPLRPLPVRPARLIRPPAAPDGPVGERDAYGDAPQALNSEHFVVKWGSQLVYQESTIFSLLQGFEDAYQRLVVEQGHPAPDSMRAYRMNVYIWDSGFGPAGQAYAAAYYTLDPEGFPMIAVNPNIMNQYKSAQGTAAHEFYHAIQGETGHFRADPSESFSSDRPARWYWEATANWAKAQVYPESIPTLAPFFSSYLSLENLPLNYFDRVDSGDASESYQYGASLFPLYLSQEIADWTLIRDSWVDDPVSSDPLEVLRLSLSEQDLDLDVLILEHLAKNIGFDYHLMLDESDNVALQDQMNWLTERSSENPRTVTVAPGGTNGQRLLSEEVSLYRYGAHLLRLPLDGQLYSVRLTGSERGSSQSEARWSAMLIRFDGEGYRYEPIAFDQTVAEFEWRSEGEERAIVLVSPSADEGRFFDSERFAYAYDVAPIEPVVASPEPSSGLGCATTSGSSGMWGFGLLLAGLCRRKSDLIAARSRTPGARE